MPSVAALSVIAAVIARTTEARMPVAIPTIAPQSHQDGMLTIEHSGDHPGLARPQPRCLFYERHRIAEDKPTRIIPAVLISRISYRVNLRICVCRFAEGLEQSFIRNNPEVARGGGLGRFGGEGGTVVLDQLAEAGRIVDVLESADMLVDPGLGHAEIRGDHLDRNAPVDALHDRALSVGKPPCGTGLHDPLLQQFIGCLPRN